MNMNKIIMTCGNIGTGKSTTVREITQKLPIGSYFVWSVDSVAQSLSHGTYDAKIWTAKHKAIYENLKTQLIASCGIMTNFTIVLDDCHMSKLERKKWIDMAKAMKFEIHLYVHKNLDNVNSRFNGDNRGYKKEMWQNISKMFASEWEEPSEEEGFNSITTVCF